MNVFEMWLDNRNKEEGEKKRLLKSFSYVDILRNRCAPFVFEFLNFQCKYFLK